MVANYLHLPDVVGNYASVPNVANLDGTGTLEFIKKVALDVWPPDANQVLISKWTGSAGYLFFLESTSNDLKLMWRDTGPARIAQATVTPTVTAGDWLWFRAIATEDGVDRDVFFYTSTDETNNPDEVTWTQLGAEVVVPFGAGDLVTNTARIFVGAQSATVATMAGDLAAARINFAGVTELDIDFTDLTTAEVDAGSFIEDSSNAATVTLNGNEWTYVRGPSIWRVVYDDLTGGDVAAGGFLSTGSVVTDPLPPGLSSKVISRQPQQEQWNTTTLQWEPEPPPPPDVDRADEIIVAVEAAQSLTASVKDALRPVLERVLGDRRWRDSAEGYEIRGRP